MFTGNENTFLQFPLLETWQALISSIFSILMQHCGLFGNLVSRQCKEIKTDAKTLT